MEIVFVVLVNFQSYVLDNIENCKRFGNHNITVLTDAKFSPHFDDKGCRVVTVESLIQNYHAFANGLQHTFWNGFYELTSYRFLVLYQYTLQHNRTNLLHLENDVMIFQDFNEFTFHDMNKILITMDNNERCIPGIVYIPNAVSLKTCYDLFDKHQGDMYNWAKCYYHLRDQNIIDTLPIFVENHAHCDNKILTNAFSFYKGIFDGAALGQYLGGIDPRNNPHDDPKNKEGVVSLDCIVNYSHWEIIWKPSASHFYLEPFIVIDGVDVKIFNLHVHCKDLKKFMREPKVPTVISGERIQALCDFYIGTHDQIHANPVFRKDIQKKHKYIHEPIDFTGDTSIQSIFCFTDILHSHFDALVCALQTIDTPFYLYFHNSDCGFNPQHTSLLSIIPNIQKIFTQNLETEPTDKLKPLPIGIANSMYAHGDLYCWGKILRTTPCKKTGKVYSQFSIDTNVMKRKKCLDIITSKGLVTQSSCAYMDYLELLRTFEFAICPEGNGIDTHRFWECLYLKTVPICLKNHLTEYVSYFFPVVLLDSWEDLDVTQLVYDGPSWPANSAEMLDIEFWMNPIKR
jgi:hypothetical protein